MRKTLVPGYGTAVQAVLAVQPRTSMILSSWFMVLVPAKMGLPSSSSPRMQPAERAGFSFFPRGFVTSSPRMQPAERAHSHAAQLGFSDVPLDHMSTPNVYFVLPRRISGARYLQGS